MVLAGILSALGAAIAMGMGAIGSAIGEAMIAGKAVEALGRQPSASPKILRMMIISQAVTETAAIFALVVSLSIIFFSSGVEGGVQAWGFLAAGLTIGIGAIGSGLGAGLPGAQAMEGVGRQPGIADPLTVHMIIGQAITQTSVIYALTIAMILVMFCPVGGVLKIFAIMGAAIAKALGAVGSGIGEGIVAKKANEALSRDIRQVGLLTRNMVIGMAITETTDIYAMVVALILVFVA